MQWQQHSELAGSHAFLSASNYSWIRYDEEKLVETYFNRMEAARGSRLHEIAKSLILEKIKLPDDGLTLSRYVNDAISFRMIPEQILFYSYNAYGTADAIKWDPRKKLLRVHDLKNGVTPAKFDQLMIYCAFFCLEYGFKPVDIDFILAIYQNDDVVEYIPELSEIVHIMDRIVTFDRKIDEINGKGGY